MTYGLDRALDGSPGSDDLDTQPRIHRGPFRSRNDHDIEESNGDCQKKCVVIGLLVAFLVVVSVSVGVILYLHTPNLPGNEDHQSNRTESAKLNEEDLIKPSIGDDLISENILLRLHNLGNQLKNTKTSDLMVRKSESNRRFNIFFNAILDNDEALNILSSDNFTAENLEDALNDVESDKNGLDDLSSNGQISSLNGDNEIVTRLLESVGRSSENSRLLPPTTSALTRNVDGDNYFGIKDDYILEAINKTVDEVAQDKEFMQKINILYNNFNLVTIEKPTGVDEIPEILNGLKFLEDENSFLGNDSMNDDGQNELGDWLTNIKKDRRFRMFLSIILQNDDMLTYFHQSNITMQELNNAIQTYIKSNVASPSLPKSRQASEHVELAPIVAVLMKGVKILDEYECLSNVGCRSSMPVDDIFATPYDMKEEHYLPAINETVKDVYRNEGFMLKVKLLYENLHDMGNRTLKYIGHGIMDHAIESDTDEDAEDSTIMKEKIN